MIVKQTAKLDKVSYHRYFDLLKQYQKEVNEIRAKRIAKTANPLALDATAQPYQGNYFPAQKHRMSNAPAPTQSSSTRSSASTRHKGKKIAKPVTPPSESDFDKDSDSEQARKDKEMQKNLALIAKYFKKLYKPTNNNLRTFSNSKKKTEDTSPRYKNTNQSGQFRNQRTMIVAGAKETVGSQAKQADWLEDTDEKIDDQELEAHYSLMANILEVLPVDSSSIDTPLEHVQNDDEYNAFANERQHSEQLESINDTYVLEKDDINVTPDSSNMCNNDNQIDQNATECADERAILANLIECNSKLEESNRALGESTSTRDGCLIALQNKQTELEKYKAVNNRTIEYEKIQTKLNETLGLLARKDIDIKEGLLKEKSKVISDLKVKEGKNIDKLIEMDKQIKFLNEIVYKHNQSIQTIHMLAPKCATYNGRSNFANPKYLKKAQSEKPCLYEIPYDTSDPANRFTPDGEKTLTLKKESRSKLNKDTVKPYDYTKQSSLYEIFKPPSQEYLYALDELQCLYLHKVKECEYFTLKLSKQIETVNKEVHNNLLKSFSKLEKHAISLELALHQYLKAKMQDKNIAINELKKLIEKFKENSVDTQFNKPSVVRQPNAQRILKPSVLGKPTPFSNSPEMRSFQMKQSVNKINVSDGLFKQVTQHIFPQDRKQAEINMNVIEPVMSNHSTSVSRPQLKSYQVKDKVVLNNSQDPICLMFHRPLILLQFVQVILFIVDSGCIKHMTGNLKLLCNFVERFPGTVRFGNDQFAPILSYGDLIQGNVKIKWVYYVEGLNHNLFSFGQFCDADLEVTFRKSTCYVKDL
uniref:Integrase, catalytic region, zinc finger, CCHC-type, peptidase aspartic, catalytic n=1 Tax=Tanacetum cinerariifolium TaxID=118510 RepID=A0A699I3Q8_TANCI|nr:integrase, catalytic region, zinc finger, CCHC-type, peptidase aspartic, catalytic [Tanacetum cinerariifolium]